jgi:phage-related protein
MNYGKTSADKVQDATSTYGKSVSNGVENVVDSARDMAQGALESASDKVELLHDKAKPVVDRIVARGQEMADHAIAAPATLAFAQSVQCQATRTLVNPTWLSNR